MYNDLYFIPLLIAALASADVTEGLRRAIHTIILLGKDERFKRGYEQFEVFMEAVLTAYQRGLRTDESEATTDDGVGESEELLNELAALPDFAEVWDSAKRDLEWEPETEIHIELLLRRNDESPQTLRLSKEDRKGFFPGVVPGAYELSVASGRVIWETTLTKRDLLSAYAFAEEPLRLAADTSGEPDTPTRQALLLDGEMAVRVFAGPEAGRVEIEWRSTQSER